MFYLSLLSQFDEAVQLNRRVSTGDYASWYWNWKKAAADVWLFQLLWQLRRLRQYSRRERKSHVVACPRACRQLGKGYTALFFLPSWHLQLLTLSNPQKKMPRWVLGIVTLQWWVAVVIRTAFCFSLQVAPTVASGFTCTQSAIGAGGVSETGPAEVFSMLSGAQACSTDHLFEWDVMHSCRRLYEATGNRRITSCAAAGSWQGRHEGNRMSVKDVLFGRAVILRTVWLRRNLMHNDKVTAAGQDRRKPHYCRHTIAPQHFFSWCFFAVTTPLLVGSSTLLARLYNRMSSQRAFIT